MECGWALATKLPSAVSKSNMCNRYDSDSDKAEYNASGKEDKEVEPCPPSSVCTSSQTPYSPDFSASTSVDEDAVHNVAGQ